MCTILQRLQYWNLWRNMQTIIFSFTLTQSWLFCIKQLSAALSWQNFSINSQIKFILEKAAVNHEAFFKLLPSYKTCLRLKSLQTKMKIKHIVRQRKFRMWKHPYWDSLIASWVLLSPHIMQINAVENHQSFISVSQKHFQPLFIFFGSDSRTQKTDMEL